MKMVNGFVSGVLRSPLHPMLSRGVGLLRYRGRLTGRTITTPTQYGPYGDDLLILVGRPETKKWWRNFTSDHALEYLEHGRWVARIGHAVVGADDPEAIRPLLDAYLVRFPKAARGLGDDAPARYRKAVIVRCRPAPATGPAAIGNPDGDAT